MPRHYLSRKDMNNALSALQAQQSPIVGGIQYSVNHTECGDTKGRLYIKKSGNNKYLMYCHNCSCGGVISDLEHYVDSVRKTAIENKDLFIPTGEDYTTIMSSNTVEFAETLYNKHVFWSGCNPELIMAAMSFSERLWLAQRNVLTELDYAQGHVYPFDNDVLMFTKHKDPSKNNEYILRYLGSSRKQRVKTRMFNCEHPSGSITVRDRALRGFWYAYPHSEAKQTWSIPVLTEDWLSACAIAKAGYTGISMNGLKRVPSYIKPPYILWLDPDIPGMNHTLRLIKETPQTVLTVPVGTPEAKTLSVDEIRNIYTGILVKEGMINDK